MISTTWLTIFGMAAVTYLTRVTALLLLRGEIAPWLRRWMSFVPIAVFAALIAPALLLRAPGQLTLDAALPAGIVGGIVAWKSGNVLLTIVAGMACYWLLRMAGM